MDENRAGGYVNKLIFNNDYELNINCNDIVVFVGPNNVGKSRALRDISTISAQPFPGIIIKDLEIKKYGGSVSNLLNEVATSSRSGLADIYDTVNGRFSVYSTTDNDFFNNQYFGSFNKLFISHIETAKRLLGCGPADAIARHAAKTHPIHYAAFDSNYRKDLSAKFKKAFDCDLIPNTQFGGKIPLCMGSPVKLCDEYEDEQDRQEKYADILAQYPQVQDQGDGMKSFVGILLQLMLDYICVYLIDEPESFLHPPQARIMGEIIGETLSNQQQAFISTHSGDIIKCLLDVAPKRLKIIRITREGNTNSFAVLDNDNLRKLWADPLLKYSNIMSAIFHKNVVLCESDSDCKMYSLVDEALKQEQNRYSETLFVHCGGKQRMAKVVLALRSLEIDVKLIPDLDVLNDEATFKGITDSFAIDQNLIQGKYRIICSDIGNKHKNVNRESAKVDIDRILDSSSSEYLTSSEIERIRSVIKTESGWKAIKEYGVSGIPQGNASKAFAELDATLKNHGIFLVPVGELENFVRTVGGHGPAWVNKVLEQYPDLNSSVYDDIKEFIHNINL